MRGVELCGAWRGLSHSITTPRHQQVLLARCSGSKDGKKKVPVRLPGGPQMPAYGGSGRFAKSQLGLGQFRPPSLFGALVANEATQEEETRIGEILEQIRGGFGTWQERAAGITELQRMGFGSEEVYMQAYVPAPMQTSMVVAAQVYHSMVEAGCSPDLLSWFDATKVDVLYSLCTLSAKQRESLLKMLEGLNFKEFIVLLSAISARATKDDKLKI